MPVIATPLEHRFVVMVTVKHNELQQVADQPTVPGLHRQQDPDAGNSHSTGALVGCHGDSEAQ